MTIWFFLSDMVHLTMPGYRRRALSVGDRVAIAAWRLGQNRYPSLAKHRWIPGALAGLGGLAYSAYPYIRKYLPSFSWGGGGAYTRHGRIVRRKRYRRTWY